MTEGLTQHWQFQYEWLRRQIGDVRGMQTDGATAEEMDEALGLALSGVPARLLFDARADCERNL